MLQNIRATTAGQKREQESLTYSLDATVNNVKSWSARSLYLRRQYFLSLADFFIATNDGEVDQQICVNIFFKFGKACMEEAIEMMQKTFRDECIYKTPNN